MYIFIYTIELKVQKQIHLFIIIFGEKWNFLF